MDTKKTMVISHAGCVDGFTSAWVASCFLGRGDDVLYRPMHHGDPLPPELDVNRIGDLYILDFSFKYETMGFAAALVDRLVCLDHHKSAREELERFERSNTTIVFDMEKSGARLTWDHFCSSSPRCAPYGWSDLKDAPALIQYVEDRDLWRKSLPQSEEINAYIRSLPMTFPYWDCLYMDMKSPTNIDNIVLAGRQILRSQRKEVESIAAHARFIRLCDHWIPIVNTAHHISEVGHQLCKNHPLANFSATFFVKFDDDRGPVLVVSLRSIGEFDVSQIATLYGGGGHRNAAGFTVDQEWFFRSIAP